MDDFFYSFAWGGVGLGGGRDLGQRPEGEGAQRVFFPFKVEDAHEKGYN